MTYYEILGVANDVSKNDIKRAYFTLVKKYSPERNPTEFKEIRKAYEVLYNALSRAEYDDMLSIPKEYADIYESGRNLLEEDYYDNNVVIKLKKAVKEKPDLYALSNMLGQIYLDNDNSGNALKIYEMLTLQQPQNIDYRVKLAESYLKRGFHKKALAEYQNLIPDNSDNATLWAGLCAAYTAAGKLEEAKQSLSDGFESVQSGGGEDMELNIAAIKLYMTDENGCDEVKRHIDILTARFEQDSTTLKPLLMSALKKILKIKTIKSSPSFDSPSFQKNFKVLTKFLLMIEPDERLEKFAELMSINEVLLKMENDANIPQFILIITDIKINGQDDTPKDNIALAVWEAECLWDIQTSRKQLIYFREIYPEQYALHKEFYNRVLDHKQEQRLIYETSKKIKKWRKEYPALFKELTDYDDDDEDENNMPNTPFKRETPKVGRNDPCPCGSGKKYKKCCGA